MMQTLLAGDNIKVKIANWIFGDQVRKQSFQTFHVCITLVFFCQISFSRDLGTEYIVTTVFQLYPTTENEQTPFVREFPC